MSESPGPEPEPRPHAHLTSTLRTPTLANGVVSVFVGCAVADVLSGGLISAVAVLVPGLVSEGPDGWARLLLSGLTHGDILDLFLSAVLALATLPLIEQVFGRARGVLVLLVATVSASAFSMALFPADAVKCGSGAVFGAVGLLLGVLTMRGSLLPDHLETGLVVVIGIGVLGEGLVGMFSPFVNNGMHLGGFLAGLLLSCVLEPRDAAVPARRKALGAVHGVVLTTGLATALVLGVERAQETLPQVFLEASADFEHGRLESAIRRMESALAHEPGGSAEELLHPLAQNQLAWCYVMARREIPKAIVLSEASNRTLESQPEFLDTLGYLYALQGDCRKAADAMGRAAALDPAYTRRRDEVNRACEQGRPADPDIPVEKPIEGLPTGPGIPV